MADNESHQTLEISGALGDFTQQQLEQSTTGKDKERNGASGEPLKRPGQQQATRSVSSVDAGGDVDDTTGRED